MPKPELEAARIRVVEAVNSLESLENDLLTIQLQVEITKKRLERAAQYYAELQIIWGEV